MTVLFAAFRRRHRGVIERPCPLAEVVSPAARSLPCDHDQRPDQPPRRRRPAGGSGAGGPVLRPDRRSAARHGRLAAHGARDRRRRRALERSGAGAGADAGGDGALAGPAWQYRRSAGRGAAAGRPARQCAAGVRRRAGGPSGRCRAAGGTGTRRGTAGAARPSSAAAGGAGAAAFRVRRHSPGRGLAHHRWLRRRRLSAAAAQPAVPHAGGEQSAGSTSGIRAG